MDQQTLGDWNLPKKKKGIREVQGCHPPLGCHLGWWHRAGRVSPRQVAMLAMLSSWNHQHVSRFSLEFLIYQQRPGHFTNNIIIGWGCFTIFPLSSTFTNKEGHFRNYLSKFNSIQQPLEIWRTSHERSPAAPGPWCVIRKPTTTAGRREVEVGCHWTAGGVGQ